MVRPDKRLTLVHAALALFGLVLVGRAAQVQLVQHERWTRRAERQHFAAADLPAPRGAILDAAGVVLAESRELVQLSVAPREVRDAAVLRRALRAAGMSADAIRRATDRELAWVELPGRHLPSDVAPLVALRGVHARPVVERVYATAAGTRALLGRARPADGGVDGVELALDALLTGERGRAQALRDARGRQFESPATDATAPRPGHAVTLTIHHTLQDITERALASAITASGASGGDIVVLDPRDGEILAMNSRRHGSRSTTGALTEPFEPG
ncbi:MAG TPA: hypothetical protein VFY16_02615, partial [Gemmatimonadaceae bacterium]|nr:hypothetical protein [Gemmatimonadaceae bacterium]